MLNFSKNQTFLRSRAFSLLILIVVLGGCAGQQVVDDGQKATAELQSRQLEQNIVDPNEKFNRSMFSFNQYFDTWVAEPISSFYLWVFPEFATTGVTNFFSNMQGINVFMNDFLQGKFRQGTLDTGRFLLNSTVGLAGLFDVATPVGLDKHDEDFDQTLAVWGVPPGDYLVLPFIGPFTYRGIPGAVFDVAANPITYLPLGFAALGFVNARANAEGSLKFIDEAALDPYVFTRESFLQWREFLATDGMIEISGEDDFFEDEFDEDFEEELDDEMDEDPDTQLDQSDSDIQEPIEARPAKK